MLVLEGSLNEEGAAELKRRSIQLIATGCNELSLHLERLSGITLVGLEALTRIEAMLPGTRRALTLTGANQVVRAQLERAGLGEYVETQAAIDYSTGMFDPRLTSSSA